MRELLSDTQGKTTAEAATLFKAEYASCYDVNTAVPGRPRHLEHLRTVGVPMAIATNRIEPITRGLIAKLGLERYFHVVIGPELVARRKPDPEAIDLILGRLKVAPARALMIGDTRLDILAGKAAGTLTAELFTAMGPRRRSRRRLQTS